MENITPLTITAEPENPSGESTMRAALISSLVLIVATSVQAEWKPGPAPLLTRWGKAVTPDKVWPEYPRPQLVRKDWLNLNGLWDYAITDRDASAPKQWQGKILVPFPIQSALSGVMTNVSENQRLWDSHKFDVPRKWSGKRVLLNF